MERPFQESSSKREDKRTSKRLAVSLPIRIEEAGMMLNAMVLDASEEGLRLSLEEEIPVDSELTIEFTAQVGQRGSWYGADPYAMSIGGSREQSVIIRGRVCHCRKSVDGHWVIGILLYGDNNSSISLLHEYLEEEGYYEE